MRMTYVVAMVETVETEDEEPTPGRHEHGAAWDMPL